MSELKQLHEKIQRMEKDQEEFKKEVLQQFKDVERTLTKSLWDLERVCREVGRKKRTVRDWVKSGELVCKYPVIEVFDPIDVARFLTANPDLNRKRKAKGVLHG